MRAKWMSVVCVCLVVLLPAAADAAGRREINFPDIRGYVTLKCDFHMHTVFSDGTVWPTVRIDEAWREGLDAISITDHIEYQPHKNDVPTNHNRPYEIALRLAQERGILLIKGAEITRSTPPGHFNAIFLDDVNPLDTKELLDAMKQASDQKAFVFWNHPGWKPEAKGWFDIHTKLYENKYIHGIEVVNGDTYYPEAHQWCLDRKLTMLGSSDIHAPATYPGGSDPDHRSLTLVFAKERTVSAVKEALVAGRTAIWFEDQIIGKEDLLGALFDASVRVNQPHLRRDRTVWFSVTNDSGQKIELERVGSQGPRELLLPARSSQVVRTDITEEQAPTPLVYEVKNYLVGPDRALQVKLVVPGSLDVRVEADTAGQQ